MISNERTWPYKQPKQTQAYDDFQYNQKHEPREDDAVGKR
jgi:hypothetical protein